MLKVKENDCFICAYAEAEGITWKVAKRRLRKVLANRKTLGVMTSDVKRLGISGYDIVPEGSASSLNKLCDFKEAILGVSWGNGQGHAVYWNGYKIIDHTVDGFLHNEKSLDKLLDDHCLVMVLTKKNTSLFSRLRSRFFHCVYLLRS